MPIEQVSTGLFDGLQLLELKLRTLDLCRVDRDATTKYNKYKETAVLAGLNEGVVEFARRTQCIKGMAIIEMKDGYAQYKPPSDMLTVAGLKAFFYQSATSYWELEQKSRAHLDYFRPGWRTVSGDPQFLYPGDNYGNFRKLGFYPKPDTDGTAYSAGDDTGVFTTSTGVTTTGNVTGLNNAASATVCTDSDGTDMAGAGVTVGLTAVNVTDGSTGQITAVSGATFTVTLTGGTADTWAVGDSYMVLAGEYGVITQWSGDEQYLFNSDIGAMIDITTLVNNVKLEYGRRPLLLSVDLQYPEIPPEFHHYLPYYAKWYLKQGASKKSEDYVDAQAGLQFFEKGLSEYSSLEDAMEDDGEMVSSIS